MSNRRKIVYRGKIITLTLDLVRLPDGRDYEQEVVRHPGGAAAVAIDPQERVCLLRQHRASVERWLWELPAGKLDPGEGSLVTAQRELQEEAGVQAADWQALGTFYSSPGVFNERMHLYLARELTHGDSDLEEHELIEVHWRPLDEAIEMCHAGEIEDAKTLIGLWRAQRFLSQVESQKS